MAEQTSREGRPWYKGIALTVNWSQIQPEKDRFDWTALDEKMRRAADFGLYVIFWVYQGYNSPHWIYERGVPRAAVRKIPGGPDMIHPYYFDPDFKPLLTRMIERTAEHLDAYPPEIRNRVVAVQVTAGKSGDMGPYHPKAPVKPEYRIDGRGREWLDWWKQVSMIYYRAYRDRKPPILVLSKGPPSVDDWLLENMPGSMRKIPNIAQGYHLNHEMTAAWFIERYSKFHKGFATRSRGEMDYAGGARPPWFIEAPVWNVYTHCLWMLTCGVDVLNIHSGKGRLLEDPSNAEGFVFFTKYAGYKDPRDSVGAWCALRDGLDVKDTERFPVETYGPLGTPDGPPGNVRNKQRFLNIAKAFADYGAIQGDPQPHFGPVKQVVRSKALNDVGYNIWPGNYRMYLYQHDPNGTSQGYFRQGPKEQPYGRFARGFSHAEGKDAMYFDIDDGFFFEKPLAGQYPVRVRVVYFDKGTGSWALRYDSADGPGKVAMAVTKTDSGRWKEKTAVVADGYFGNRCPNETDLMLVNTDDEDDVFHMIEVTRKTGYRTGYFGYVGSEDK